MTHCCSNESISNIDIRTLVKAIYLAHCSAWTDFRYIKKNLLFGGSLDEFSVFFVVIVTPKEVELQLFPLYI